MNPDVVRWRKAERARLIAARQALPPGTRHDFSARIAAHLDAFIGEVRDRVISVYWPMRAEPDLRPLMKQWHERGAQCALPVVVARDEPMVFRLWRPGMRMQAGVWNMPIPETGVAVRPDVIVAPVVGFDAQCYRLGYGGGFFDRTLASTAHAPVFIGVAFDVCRMPSVQAQTHDIPMQALVSEAGVLRC